MIFPFAKKRPPEFGLDKFEGFCRVMRDMPPHSERFPETLQAVARISGVRGASIYLYEARTDVFLLKTWSGSKPSRMSVSGGYEFVRHLALNGRTAYRRDYASPSDELRKAAMVFFHQTSSDRVFPIVADGEWTALLTADAEDCVDESAADALLHFYADQIALWALTRRLSERARKFAEIGHVKNQLLANVTHELETPLNGILGVAEGILDGGDGPVEGALKEHVRMILKAGRDLHATIENILRLTRIEARKNEIRLERVSIGALVDEVAQLFERPLAEKGVALSVPDASQSVEVFVEPDQIRTVLMNLIGNAVKFTEAGRITVAFKRSGDMLHVAVSDTGIGIDPDKLDLIFEDFYQADGSVTRVYGGTGLGLAIAKKIISLHGGRIWAESQKGSGTKITFTVPVFPA